MSRFNNPTSTKYGTKIDNYKIIQNIVNQHKLEIIHEKEMIEITPVVLPKVDDIIEPLVPVVPVVVEVALPVVEKVEPVVYKHRPTLIKAKSELIKVAMPLL